MKHSLYRWQIAGFVFTAIIGTLLHFVYNWTEQCVFVAWFSPVNESTWEHMKLLFFPMFLFSLIEYRFIGKQYKNYWCATLAGILVGLMLIPVIYYTYQGILGSSLEWFNIAIFFIATAGGYLLQTWLLKQNQLKRRSNIVPFLILCLAVFAFVVLTFYPPHIPLFEDLANGTYGTGKKTHVL